jgi:sodium/pantothenate symporter
MSLTYFDWAIFLGVPIIAWLIGRQNRQVGTWRGYFLANNTLGGVSSAATYFGANLTFTSIFLILSEEAYRRGPIVICIPLFWLLGTWLTYRLYPKIKVYIQNGATLHQVLGTTYQSNTMQRWASIWTIFAFVGTVALEFYGGIRLLQWAKLPFFTSISLAMFLAFVVAAFTITGGFRGVALADIFLDVVSGLGVLVLAFLLFHHGPLMVPSLMDVGQIAEQPISTTDNVLFVIGMGLIFIPFQLCALDSWQRFAATRANKDKVPGWLLPGGLILSLVYLIPILIGVSVWSHGITIPPGGHPLKVFLDGTHLPPGVAGLVFAGFLAAIFSTADELLNCCALSWLFDWLQIPRLKPERTSIDEKKIVLSGQFYTGLFALVAAGIALLAIQFERNVSDLAIAVFSGQVLFAPPLALAMFLPDKAALYRGCAKLGMLLGFAGILGLVITGWVIGDKGVSDAAPVGGLFLSLLVYAVKYVSSKMRG